jgi:hypothetical protein
MDYRLVKQYLNDAIDNFFNFFYKIADFGKVLIDTGLSFYDIWYNFVMFFVNLFLYVYFLLLYAIDRMSMSDTPLFFWRRKGTSTRRDFQRAYNRNMINPVSGMYAKPTGKSVTTPISSGTSQNSSTKASSGNVQSSSASSVVAARVTVKTNLFSRFFSAIGNIIAGIFIGIFTLFKNLWEFLISKLKPVKEQPVGRKNLIDDYMKQYETTRKKR